MIQVRTLKQRVSLVVYVIAIQSILGEKAEGHCWTVEQGDMDMLLGRGYVIGTWG